jgi:glucan phosphoethanolaminetransferase (alkaline phosphatase superfamily)
MLRILLIIEFLIAIQAVFTFWSQVGGQYHLDLMFWPWKFGLSLAAALLITLMTMAFARGRKPWALGVLLIVTVAIAGYVTYYYHLNEPSDEDDSGDNQTTITQLLQDVS